jgi:hypothetical protein
MDIALDAKVHFSEGGTGEITKVVVNPITGEMTHVVVRAKGSFEVEYLVPVDKIAESTPHDVNLAITMNDLRLMETIRPPSSGPSCPRATRGRCM